MNCEKCLAQFDEYLNGELNSADCAAVKAHLESCLPCISLSADLSAILNCCAETREHLESPPNPQALWLRISNIVEYEQSVMVAAGAKTGGLAIAPKPSLWTRSWQLSMQQMAVAVIGVAVITSLLTIVSVQNALQSRTSQSPAQFDLFGSFGGDKNKTAATVISVSENRVQQQEMAIEYWNRRVELRKTQWNRHLQDAFDRNLHEIDQVVADYQQQLQINPEDKISEEMLDSALNDKMALLREFSEL
ncbi:MAG: zf-HC2 domain-containing protein [Pyrinomonadaceae bacterium]